jgi:hypothetical protein
MRKILGQRGREGGGKEEFIRISSGKCALVSPQKLAVKDTPCQYLRNRGNSLLLLHLLNSCRNHLGPGNGEGQ